MIRAIIFDMDGVLIEAKDWHYEALNRALRLFGLEISRYEHLSVFDGLPTRDKLEMLSVKSEGYKIAVCSNSIRKSIEVMMQKAALDSYLDFYLSNEDVSKGKPDPQMYNKAIEKFGLNPKECLIIEDNENGIKAAKASGANVMIVSEVDEVNYDNIKAHINKFKEAL